MILRYNLCDVELPFPGLFPYIGFTQEYIQGLLLGLTYLCSYPFPGLFPYLGFFPGLFFSLSYFLILS